MGLCCTDVAVIVFNKCTKDNNGKPVPLEGGGTEVVTQDSNNFKITFDYEFLEDFREKKTQGVTIRNTITRRQQEYDLSSREALIDRDKVDGGFIQSAFHRVVTAPDPSIDNNWGPEGFTKSNHPLNIMVRTCEIIY